MQVTVALETAVMIMMNSYQLNTINCSVGTSKMITVNFTCYSTVPDYDLHGDSR